MDLNSPSKRRKWFGKLQTDARNRAKKASKPYDLPDGYAESLWQRQDGRCAVTGIQFHFEKFPDAFVKCPLQPSLDRRLNAGGYTQDNVRLVCAAVNFGMGQWGEEVFLTLARAAIDLDAGRASSPGARSKAEAVWRESYLERMTAVEKMLHTVPEREKRKLRNRIAGLKAAMAKGPGGLKAAAAKAAAAKSKEPRGK